LTQLATLSVVSKAPGTGWSVSTAVLRREVKVISSAIKFRYFLLRTRATSGAGPMLRMMCPTTGRSAEQARGTRATRSGGFSVRVFARGRRRTTGGAGTTTKTLPAGTTVHHPGRSGLCNTQCMGTLVWDCAINMGRITGGAQSPAGGQVRTARLRTSGGIIARPASTAPDTTSLVESRAPVEVRATSGVTLLPLGTTAPPNQTSSKKPELNLASCATESVTKCLPATFSVRRRWPLAGASLGGITVQRTR